MKVYIEFIFILNLWIDFLLLLSESFILKKKTSIKRIILASTLGSSLSFIVLLDINDKLIIIYRLIICIIMLLISFNFNDLKTMIQDVVYFYLVSIILAGFVYLVREYIDVDTFLSNFIVLVFLSPCILYFYVKCAKKEKDLYSKLYNVKVIYKNKEYLFTGFLDTGNKLYDQYKHRPIILVYTKKIKFNYKDGILVPYETASGKSIIRCIVTEKVTIDGVEYKNILLGLNEKKFNIENVDMILHGDMMGG